MSPTVIKKSGVGADYFASRFSSKVSDKDFKLDKAFLADFLHKKPNFGYGGLGEFVFYRTYARLKPDGTKESFLDTITRVVEGTYEIQRRHCRQMHIPWNRKKAQVSAQEMFRRMWEFKFLPPGRGLWAMGTDFMWERGSAALNNCGFISTKELATDPAGPFKFMIDMSMLGVGIGFDTKGAGKVRITLPHDKDVTYIIEDSREGWADSVRALIESYTTSPEFGRITFNYAAVRPAGSPINGFGGTASGPGILMDLHAMIRTLLEEVAVREEDQMLTSVDIVDIMNFIGRCVVAGNVRRTAEIAFGNPNDDKYVQMKDYTKHPEEVKSHRWASNNSVFGHVGMDYTQISEQIALNGEPGFIWLDNIRNFGRMIDGRQQGIDRRAAGANPCVEQSLESHELCCLVETFPANHDDAEDYKRTLKFAYLYAKTVTLLPTHCSNTNSVLLRNRRIGLSQSGIVQAFNKFGRRAVLQDFCDEGYKTIRAWDTTYSDWLCVGQSIKVTSVKPSGTVSLVAGATAGIHYTIAPSRSYWRRVRLASDSALIPLLVQAGYHVEPIITDPLTSVVKFGVSEPDVKTVRESSIWEQVKNAVDYQRYWADNQVSCTIQFSKDEAGEIPKVLEAFDDELKGISWLPMEDHGYAQAPYEAASFDDITEYNNGLTPLNLAALNEDGIGTKFCDGDTCEL